MSTLFEKAIKTSMVYQIEAANKDLKTPARSMATMVEMAIPKQTIFFRSKTWLKQTSY
jgi:hypothetical protein